jgi:hypothetical protein
MTVSIMARFPTVDQLLNASEREPNKSSCGM